MNTTYKLSYVIVDDDEDDRMLMRLALEKSNRLLPVFEFADGQELLDYLKTNAQTRADKAMHWLVVMDINMPRLNGLDTLSQLRQDPDWSTLPVLILSTSDDPAMIRESVRRGADGFITKPRSLDEFTEIFDKHFAPWLAIDSTQWPAHQLSEG